MKSYNYFQKLLGHPWFLDISEHILIITSNITSPSLLPPNSIHSPTHHTQLYARTRYRLRPNVE